VILDVLLILAAGFAIASCTAAKNESDYGMGVRMGVFICAIALAVVWGADLVLHRW